MSGYDNKPCACCGEKFKADDDIVVCPECGTPMHRACWSGHCPNEQRHAEGFDWDSARKEVELKEYTEARYRCEICGFKIMESEEKLFCPDCGSPMHKRCYDRTNHCPHEEEHAFGYDYHNAQNQSQQIQPPIRTVMSFDELMDNLRNNPMKVSESGEEATCFGVKQKELLHFLGTKSLSTPQFFTKFMNMARSGKKVSLNFFAGIFMPFYQFYRKMTGPALLLTFAYFILNIPNFFVRVSILKTGFDMLDISPQLLSIYNIMTYIGLAIEFLLILFNDYIYMKWSVGKILSLREQYQNASEAEYLEALERAGKPRMAFAFIAIAVVTIVSVVALSFFGGELIL